MKRRRLTLAQRVKQGLDRIIDMCEDGWQAHIHYRLLDMGYPLDKRRRCCLLAQMFGSYREGLRLLEIPTDEISAPQEFGFDIYHDESATELTKEWQRQLRRAFKR